KAKVRRDRQCAREKHLAKMPTIASIAEAGDCEEPYAVLDEEIQLLPERYRLPIILCYMQEKSHEEAARELGCPRGTVSTRLMRARERLRDRLTRRGLHVSAGLLVVCLAKTSAPAAVPIALVNSAVNHAVLLASTNVLGVTEQFVELVKGVGTTMT